ncbi:MAG: DNRLRE domain-containing protein, partial [Dehalococcoidia bacterium]
ATTRPPTPTPTPLPTATPQGTPVPDSSGNVVLTLGASKDNTLYEHEFGLMSNGAGAHIFAGNTRNSESRRALIAFDIAGALPAGAQVQSVSLALFMSQTTALDEPVSLHRVLADWREGLTDAMANEGGGGAAQGDDATWTHAFKDVTPWETPGGDFESSASASTVVRERGSTAVWESAGMVEDVQSWLDNPQGNFGWLLKGNEDDQRTAKRFDSRQHFDEPQRPVLTVAFTFDEALY